MARLFMFALLIIGAAGARTLTETSASADATTDAGGADASTPSIPTVVPSIPSIPLTPTAMPTAPVQLNSAGDFVILSKSGITDVPSSEVSGGDVGTSPITGAAIHLTCSEVADGNVYAVNAAGPAPCSVMDPNRLTTAVNDMEAAYTAAANRDADDDKKEVGAGEISGMTLSPGTYKWSTSVLINTDVTLEGDAGGLFSESVWIFQISQQLSIAPAMKVLLTNGAQAKNVFWQVAGAVTLGTTSEFEGTILTKTMIAMNTGASINGRLLAQTAVTLQKVSVKMVDPK